MSSSKSSDAVVPASGSGSVGVGGGEAESSASGAAAENAAATGGGVVAKKGSSGKGGHNRRLSLQQLGTFFRRKSNHSSSGDLAEKEVDEYSGPRDPGYRLQVVKQEYVAPPTTYAPVAWAKAKHADPLVWEEINLRVLHPRGKTGFEETKDFNIKVGDVIAGRYKIVEYLGSAAFSSAVQCLDMETNELVCAKIIVNNKDFFDQSLDEIKLLQYINAAGDPDEKNVVRLLDYFYFKEHLFLIFELLRDNLYEVSKYYARHAKESYFTKARLQRVARQILEGLEFVHGLGLIHCDLKPENVLIKSYSRCLVKIIDFGSSCFTVDHLGSYVQSRSYRAPEVILGLPYDQKIDIWSLGCVIAELFTGKVLFFNSSCQTLLARIQGIIHPFPQPMLTAARFQRKYYTDRGSGGVQLYDRNPDAAADDNSTFVKVYPKNTTLAARLGGDPDPEFVDFIACLLRIDLADRPTAAEALKHPWFNKSYTGNTADDKQPGAAAPADAPAASEPVA